MALFKRRRPNSADPVATAKDQLDGAAKFDPDHMRGLLFSALAKRVGQDNVDAIREDFDRHVAKDPRHGVEAAYVCLTGKLIDYIDVLNEDEIPVPTAASNSPFAVYRKEI